MMCERCKDEVHFVQIDQFCNRMICNNCMKASKNPLKTKHVAICKDCWSDMKKRHSYKTM